MNYLKFYRIACIPSGKNYFHPDRLALSIMSIFIFKHNHTPSGKKPVTGMQVVTTSQVQIIGCRSKAILFRT